MDKNEITVLSFDMGKGNTGWSILKYNILENKFTIMKTGLITASKTSSKVAFRDEVNRFGEPVVTFAILEKEIEKIVKAEKPDFTAVESAWSKHHVTAYTSLILCIFVTANLLRRYGLKLYEIAPTQAKACLAGNGRADKNGILTAIKNNANICTSEPVDLNTLTEHESDSISIGYTFCIQVLPQIVFTEKENDEKKE